MNIQLTDHVQAEWSRMAQAAYVADLNSIGHLYSAAASLPRGGWMLLSRFDALQSGYRLWLTWGFAEAAPFIHQHCYTTETTRTASMPRHHGGYRRGYNRGDYGR